MPVISTSPLLCAPRNAPAPLVVAQTISAVMEMPPDVVLKYPLPVALSVATVMFVSIVTV